MLYIVSPGRCGSGWLSTVLMACGSKVVHEWYPSTVVDPDVISDTSVIWNQTAFLDNLKLSDVIILLDRPAQERSNSVNRLLGSVRTWESVDTQWDLMKSRLEAKRHLQTFSIDYDKLIYHSRNVVWAALKAANATTTKERFNEVWDFMSCIRATNLVAERACFASYNGDIENVV